MIRRPPRSTHCISSAASDVYKRQVRSKGKEALTAVDVAVKTPLHIVSSNGHTQLAETLLKMGSPVDPQDKFLRTPLHLAASAGHETVANVLLSFGADVQAKDAVLQ
eukprot:TRINITY_DN16762_c0_g1_i1.p2 TRINITY_DN16762_c0_g1~~TRINITY_DN16762_c0_g1_i1.p2  ORF type:complete len:117 (-),score=44.75 TRINITY_DN16762_c0_g1_i1:392-712(-)